jgi:non-ribosomal peptide synthetase-like protein
VRIRTVHLLRSEYAAPPRTLVDILVATVEAVPDAPAIDNGAESLTYAEFLEAARETADELAARGIGPGDKVGVRIVSGTLELYLAITGVLLAGAAYVPVDADDPDERARTVFDEAGVAAVVTDGLVVTPRVTRGPRDPEDPTPADDAWVIFTSGSTGTPKGVAVTHRNAAAFVDAETRMFLQEEPLGVGDRVMAGLSVAFDASCEEMWLAWAYGACLVPAPRSLVRSGMDLGPWLVANGITVVSTVPTLVALWPVDALSRVRLLILGGEACPPEIGERLATAGREVWNTYGPTEATVVACGARLTGDGPVRIGLPLDGWDLAVVDGDGRQVAPGETGELIIGGVGLARYLDPDLDAERYAALPSLGWSRAYRSGDLVRYDEQGLLFVGRADDQVKLGGRRIELGEIDSALLGLPGVDGAAAAVRSSKSGNKLLVGYLRTNADFDAQAATAHLRATMPAPLVPRLVRVDALPTRTSGKIDRDALPWPMPTLGAPVAPAVLRGTEARIQELWSDLLGAEIGDAGADFFDLGGSSLTAAQLVSRLREDHPEITVADVYAAPTLRELAALVDDMDPAAARVERKVRPVPVKTQVGQLLATVPLRAVSGLRILTWLAAGCAVTGWDYLPSVSWWWVLPGLVLLVTPPGRIVLGALGARLVLAGVAPGEYPRGGKVHLRVWLAERLVEELGAANVAGAPLIKVYARALGATVGRHVDLHSVPPVTGMLTLGDRCSIEPEVDLTGYWIDGDVFHVGRVEVGAGARVGARSMLLGGTAIGAGAEIAPGAAVFGPVPAGQYWSGAPATRAAKHTRGPWGDEVPANRPVWLAAYAASSLLIAGLPVLAVVAGLAPALPALSDADSPGDALATAVRWLPLGTVVGLLTLALGVLAFVRLLGLGLSGGHYPVHGRVAWQAWSTLRVLDEARTWLFPLYASTLTPAWLRALGASVGKDVEASTVLLIPSLTEVREGAFLADDTLLGGYELGGGWLRIDRVRVGKHAFVGNSGMTAPGRKVPKQGLVAVLSAAPRRNKAKAGTSWIGSPPTRLRRARGDVDQSRTYHPAIRFRVARALVEACRLVPVMVGVGVWLGVLASLAVVADRWSWWAAAALAGPVVVMAGAVAAGTAVVAKWSLVGRLSPGSHPLWCSLVWRNELADTFVETIAAPWFARPATGTWILNVWLRAMGARIGRGVWCETYWLPEADLIELRDGATVNQGCVVQTHLFHDRMLSMDTVRLRAGATLGPNSVVLPAAELGRHATVGPVSLVMRGEVVPDKTRWIGNPIAPWADEE